MKSAVFAVLRDEDSDRCPVGRVYWDWGLFFSDTFPCNIHTDSIIELSVNGKTYAQKKASVSDKARIIQEMLGECSISYFELSEIQNWLLTVGKRYGLMEEFKDNAVV